MDQIIANLRAIVGAENVLSEPDELLVYECDGLTQHKHPPRAVVFPATTEEVSKAVHTLVQNNVSFAPRGAGTGLSGGALAIGSGVIIELARMRRLLKVDAENRLAVVQTGMVNAQLSRAVAAHGLYYVPDPSSGTTCTIGGNIAENAGGIHCLKYGTTTDHVLGLRLVLPDGEIIDLGGVGADNTGYDLRGIFIGSEGTFGIATEAIVRLTPLPAAVRTLLADFTDVNDASRAVSAIIAGGLIPAGLEMVDGATIRAVEASVFAAGLPLDAEAALLIELDGLADGLDEEAARAEAICRKHGARQVRHAADEYERKKLWAARKGAFGAMGRLAPDLMIQDAVVPRSRLPEVLAETYRISAKYGLQLANVFHAGDGNLHPLICFDRRNADEELRVAAAGKEIMETCVRAGGSITGEHGVGLDKSAYLPLIFSADDLTTMLEVRAAFDQTGLCNPGKIIPAPRGCGEARVVSSKSENRNDNESKGAQTTRLELFARHQRSAPPVEIATRHARSFEFEAAQRELAGIVGEDNLGLTNNMLTVAPATVNEAQECVRLAARKNWTWQPAGACAWLDVGNPLHSCHLIITTRRMTRLIAYEPADLVATVEAGMPFASFNEEMSRAGSQWLPLDPPDDGRATLGGVAATASAGAQSLGYGAVRGYVLGMKIICADGRMIKAGGRVVKNVAGYDLCKLYVGSYGTLGLVTELTFKLRPRPACEATVIVRASDVTSLFKAAHSLPVTQFSPVAVEMLSPRVAAAICTTHREDTSNRGFALLFRFAGTERAVNTQLVRACSIFEMYRDLSRVETIEDDAHIWRALAAQPLKENYPIVGRVMVHTSDLPDLIALLAEANDWHASVGTGGVRFMRRTMGDVHETIAQLTQLRTQAQSFRGSLVLERAPDEVKLAFDCWGVSVGPARLMLRIKQQLDPRDLLAPGRFDKQAESRTPAQNFAIASAIGD